ncbi:MAG: methyltransferase domain-containing protein [Nitrospirota bacterium]
MSPLQSDKEIKQALVEHLSWWGLRRFDTDEAYFRWQRETLSAGELADLQRLAERKRSAEASAEVAFYDRAADARILPVLYSQRYDYYINVGLPVAEQIGALCGGGMSGSTVLDFGCGIGLLTGFYARQFPALSFVGLDRSPASISVARERARALGLANVRFDCVDVEAAPCLEPVHLVLSTHALLQAEQEPGLPSLDWRTFERGEDPEAQARFEKRTGLGLRLDRLCAWLAPDGLLIVFEKARLLARRVPFQRAFASRGFRLLERPLPIRYPVVEEVTDDGPLYVMTRSQSGEAGRRREGVEWDEAPEALEEPDSMEPPGSAPAQGADSATTPLYENHFPSAQSVWERLPHRTVLKETTWEGADGYRMHVELGTTDGLLYLYQANTFDQRQLVLVEPERSALLEQYYQEIVEERQK